MSPWRALAPGNIPASSEADSFFSVNIIVRPPLQQTTSQIINFEDSKQESCYEV